MGWQNQDTLSSSEKRRLFEKQWRGGGGDLCVRVSQKKFQKKFPKARLYVRSFEISPRGPCEKLTAENTEQDQHYGNFSDVHADWDPVAESSNCVICRNVNIQLS